MKKRLKTMLLPIIIIVIGIVIDQVTKAVSFAKFSETTSYPVLPPLFKFDLVRNTGAAFGTLSGALWLFIIITVIACGVFVWLAKYVSFTTAPIFSCCYCLFVIGTLGNFIDRIVLGYVRDFLTFGFFSFPSFNFADMCMTFGVIILLYDILFGEYSHGELFK